jgi:uracil-DNA glycosylase
VAAGAEVYPAQPLRALETLMPQQVRVVILGQDPYHGPGEAEGLAFSVADGVKIPPSLRNIRQELVADLGLALPASGSLRAWTGQGVLLLNTCLTVERDRPASHAKRGWEGVHAVGCARASQGRAIWRGWRAEPNVGVEPSLAVGSTPTAGALCGQSPVQCSERLAGCARCGAGRLAADRTGLRAV